MALLAVSEYSLRRYFFGRTYSYYASTEVYWEDQQTLLLYLPDPLTMWRLRPSISLSVEEWIQPYGQEPTLPIRHKWNISTNEHGYRSPEFDRTKPNGKVRILCLGDSRTLGEGLKIQDTYPSQLNILAGPDIEVINTGTDGWSAFQGRALLEHEALAYDPDIVVACFGINDTDRAWGVSDSVRAARANRTYVSAQALLYRSMTYYAAARAYLKAQAWLFGKTAVETAYGTGPPRLAPDAYVREISEMSRICDARGIRLIYIILPVNKHYPWRTEDGKIQPFTPYNQLAAMNRGLSVLDLRRSRLSTNPESHFIDDMHLSRRGTRYVAERLASSLALVNTVDSAPVSIPPGSGR